MIVAEGLTKYYGDTCAVSNLDFRIEQGEIVGILGLNGAGKTTTLRMLSCLLLPSAGRVTVGGVDVADDPHAVRRLVGFLPEEPPLYREMTVRSFLTFAGELRGLSRAEATGRLDEVLEITGTTEVRGQVIDHLSHGFRKRVGIAQAIIHRPPVVILDEPISGLDPVQIVEMRKLIRNLGGRHTVLVSSHILTEISQTCDHLLVIQGGELVAAGTEEEVLGRASGAHRVRLTVRGDGAQAERTLKAVKGVQRLERRPDPEPGVHDLLVETDVDRREALGRAVISADLGLLRLSPAESELESVFLELTRAGASPRAEREVAS